MDATGILRRVNDIETLAVQSLEHQEQASGASMSSLGQITALYIANATSKTGRPAPDGYDPSVVLEVEAIRITARGSLGLRHGSWIPDVHHRDHPQSRNRDDNDISLNFTGHYAKMIERFGPRITPGCAGENIIVSNEKVISADEIETGILIHAHDGTCKLESLIPTPPCAPFSGWALAKTNPEPSEIKAALQFLQHGTRGFYVKYSGEDTVIRVNDLVTRA
jgi:hypothetical protein